ncbi:Cell division control protein 42 [Mycena sanguinolenta]|uniref:Cell division control protein 42 n=1 Tax=Mycena sanguinolenta TaxID=230812 RepID=A0A8H6XIC8_9AGAR|nr:Cell division control protein 42 [Mycena sanguinolenta]
MPNSLILLLQTCLLTSYADKKFQTEYIPTVFGGYAITVMVGDVPYTFGVFDTLAGSPWDRENERLRPLSYPRTDVFIVCFSVGMPVSFHNVKHKWFPEAEHFCPGVPCVVAATQIDLRPTQNGLSSRTNRSFEVKLPWQKDELVQSGMITTAEGKKLADELNAAGYVECSAKTHEGVHAAFDAAIIAAVQYQQRDTGAKKKWNCVVV